MSRQKNALTKYFVGPWTDDATSEATLRLGKWISSVTDDSDESTEDTAFYDGDGTPESDVVSVKKSYSFEGMYDESVEAMKFIASLELETGESRKIAFKQERTDGSILEGRATVTEIKVTGGEASEYATFSCKIGWDAKPKVTPAP
ncbi:phage tail tube protein [Lysinibacillus sp. NPDC096418]|uniref:phage tail tube protein n=1 Tax=Lysinibacillus sp. NPDC096418 TaxID=3364138 RepID=UPI00380EAA0D